MIPVSIDPTALAVAVAGRGAAALRRWRGLQAGGAMDAVLFCDKPSDEIIAAAGPALRWELPDADALGSVRLLWVTGLPDGLAVPLAHAAREARVLVNVEDRPELCDFHSAAEIRRGALLLTVSTGGRSPRLAARVRAKLGEEFGPEWASRVEQLGRLRAGWRRQRRSMADLAALTDRAIDAEAWLG